MIPLMYLILVANAGVLAIVYFGSAPIWLTAYMGSLHESDIYVR